MRKLLLLILMVSSNFVFAEENSYWFAGVGHLDETIKASSFGAGASSTGGAFQLDIGHKFHKNFGLEADAMQYTDINFPGGTSSGYSLGVSALAIAPMVNNVAGNEVSFFGKIGFANTVFKLSPATGYTLVAPASQSKNSIDYGVGLQAADSDIKSNPIMLRISYDVHTGGGNDMSVTFTTITVSAGTSF